MKLLSLLAILLLLVAVSTAELAADVDRFELELHPGEMTERVLALENSGDGPIRELTMSPVAGSARDLVEMEIEDFEMLLPGEKAVVDITFTSPSETIPGTYSGFVYFFDDTSSLPIMVEFVIEIIEQESYGVSFSIDDARSASLTADPDEPAEFELLVRNAGLFKDVISIDAPQLPPRWTATLFDGADAVALPYNLTLSSGVSRILGLEIAGGRPGETQMIEIEATSLGDPSKNATVTAEIELNHEIRQYEAIIDLPAVMVTDRTHTGSISIVLNVDELISVEIAAPPEILVMPESQVIPVGETRSGKGEFTLLATEPGRFEIEFYLHDSYNISLPTESAEVLVVDSAQFAIVTGDGLLYRALALSYSEGVVNDTVPVITLKGGELSDEDIQLLEELPLAKVVILGNESVVSSEVETLLSEMMPTERIGGDDICETSWLFASTIWPKGVIAVVLAGSNESEAFAAYQEAKKVGAPLIICGAPLSETSSAAMKGMKEEGLSRALIGGAGVDANAVEALKDEGLSIEEVG
ncbi:MAG TPA: hypothetical protein PLQ49_00515 [Methanothrix sp.]|nr:hypothetical protein [Methanothrix sp.]HRW82318.1 hypothetical protein [Methanothrix sp.]